MPLPAVGLATTADELVAAIDDNTAAVVVQYPNFFGTIEDLAAIADAVHAAGAYLIVATYPVPLSLLKPPGAYGADFVTAEGQSLGVAQSLAVRMLDCSRRSKSSCARCPVDWSG